jgi:hypothetical protein
MAEDEKQNNRELANSELSDLFNENNFNLQVTPETKDVKDIGMPMDSVTQSEESTNVNNVNVNINVSKTDNTSNLETFKTNQKIQNTYNNIINKIIENPLESEDLKKNLEIRSPNQNLNIEKVLDRELDTTEQLPGLINPPVREQTNITTNNNILLSQDDNINSFNIYQDSPNLNQTINPNITTVMTTAPTSILSTIQENNTNTTVYRNTVLSQPQNELKVSVNRDNDLNLTSEVITRYNSNLTSLAYEKDQGLVSMIKSRSNSDGPESEELTDVLQEITNTQPSQITPPDYKTNYFTREDYNMNSFVEKTNSSPIWRTVLG